MSDTFETLGLPADLIEGIAALGIETPTPIQCQAIPFLLKDGGDLIAQAQTGTGKTAAFGLPLLTRIDLSDTRVQALIVAPTRELAKQIGKQLFRYTKFCAEKTFVEVAAGGDKIDLQAERLQRPTHILVATPGRLMDLLEMDAVSLDAVKYLVLDEADEMLSMGFRSELAEVFKRTAKRRSTWLFSATFQDKVQRLVADHMSPKAHMLKVEKKAVVNRNIDHQYAVCAREDKDAFVLDYLKSQGEDRGLIFVRTKAGAIRLGEVLVAAGLTVGVIQGDLSQKDRDKVMRIFKRKESQFLIATDVAARGIDIEGLSFVIQHQLPDAMQYYTHRAGRTARAGKTGTSLTLIEPKERSKISKLEQSLALNFTLVDDGQGT